MFNLVKVCFASSVEKEKMQVVKVSLHHAYCVCQVHDRNLILWEPPSNKTTINIDKSNTPGETADGFVSVNYFFTKR